MTDIFYSGTESLARTLIVGIAAYVTLVTFLRLSGSRTLAKMNAFDLVVTVALGSTLASVLLNKDVALAEGTLALVVLIGLQFAVSWTSVRARWVRRLVTGDPLLLLRRGTMLAPALRHARVTEDEVRAAVRAAGMAALHDVEAVVLETDGSFSVVPRSAGPDTSSLNGVHAVNG
jgi:uncharacterized membrane protein YcaP (DUF421 family)